MSAPLTSEQLASFKGVKTLIIDNDDCIYDMDCGLHEQILESVANVFNDLASQNNDPKKTTQEIGNNFNAVIQYLDTNHTSDISKLIRDFYGSGHELITPSQTLVTAFRTMAEKGVERYFYTNGPAFNVKKTLERHGFAPTEIEDLVNNRTFDLLQGYENELCKPNIKGMEHVLDKFNINPKTAFMADDNIRNLKTAAEFGIKTLWTWTSDKEPSDELIQTAEDIGAIRVRHAGDALLQIARAL